MFLTPSKRKILHGLRDCPLDHYQLAADIGEAPFLVRAELLDLKRDRLVTDRIRERRDSLGLRFDHKWELTTRGWQESLAADQLELAP